MVRGRFVYDFETRTEGPIIKMFGTITDYLFQWLRSAPSVGDVSRGLRDGVHVCACFYVRVYIQSHVWSFIFKSKQQQDPQNHCIL